MTSTTKRARAPQRRVHCTKCPWSGKRAAEAVEEEQELGECPHCGSPIEAGSGQVGRPALDPKEKRVEQRCSVLPSTIKELERAGLPYEIAAAVLDEWAEGQRASRRRRRD